MRAGTDLLAVVMAAGALTCSSGDARLALDDGVGPDPRLPPPVTSLVPLVKIAAAKGWSGDAKPTAAAGLDVTAFADGLEHPRWVYVLPDGDVLVAETAAPPNPEPEKGLKAYFMKRAMERAGAAVPSANRITLLRDSDGDGVAA